MRTAIALALLMLPALCEAQASSKNEEFQNATIARFRAMPGVEARDHSEDHVIEFINRAQGAVILLTTPGHPAHPAQVKHQAVEKDGQLFIETTSSSGGDREALKKWVDHMASEHKAAIARRREAQPADAADGHAPRQPINRQE